MKLFYTIYSPAGETLTEGNKVNIASAQDLTLTIIDIMTTYASHISHSKYHTDKPYGELYEDLLVQSKGRTKGDIVLSCETISDSNQLIFAIQFEL